MVNVIWDGNLLKKYFEKENTLTTKEKEEKEKAWLRPRKKEGSRKEAIKHVIDQKNKQILTYYFFVFLIPTSGLGIYKRKKENTQENTHANKKRFKLINESDRQIITSCWKLELIDISPN